MFDKQYRFKGRHALRVDQLTGVFDELKIQRPVRYIIRMSWVIA